MDPSPVPVSRARAAPHYRLHAHTVRPKLGLWCYGCNNECKHVPRQAGDLQDIPAIFYISRIIWLWSERYCKAYLTEC